MKFMWIDGHIIYPIYTHNEHEHKKMQKMNKTNKRRLQVCRRRRPITSVRVKRRQEWSYIDPGGRGRRSRWERQNERRKGRRRRAEEEIKIGSIEGSGYKQRLNRYSSPPT